VIEAQRQHPVLLASDMTLSQALTSLSHLNLTNNSKGRLQNADYRQKNIKELARECEGQSETTFLNKNLLDLYSGLSNCILQF
jgi:hypothetical protein